MIRVSSMGLALLLAGSVTAHAADPPVLVAASYSPEAIQRIAEKQCNEALDHERFDWSSMEECISDKSIKLQKQQRQSDAPAANHPS